MSRVEYQGLEKENKINHEIKQAILIWMVFITCAIFINIILPLMLRINLLIWTYSNAKKLLFGIVIYASIFFITPIILTKEQDTVKRLSFSIPLIIGFLTIGLWEIFRGIYAIALIFLIYLHIRFNLSELGIRSSGWEKDIFAIGILGIIYSIPALIQINNQPTCFDIAFIALLDRLFANPAASIEIIFYFGFLAERLSKKFTIWQTTLIIAGLYVFHEIMNPEYWYEGVNFLFIFIGLLLTSLIYFWRRNVLVLWLGSGLGVFLSLLI